MFKQEMAEAKSAPPLVFDLALVKAARWHSYYIIANTQVHKEEEGKEGFTAKNPMERCILAGFKGNMFGENVGRDGREAWYCHCAYVIDWGPGGSGGMQPGGPPSQHPQSRVPQGGRRLRPVAGGKEFRLHP